MGQESPKDRSDEQLTPQEAYNLTENQGMKGKTVAKMFDITPGRVSQLKGQYQEGIDTGKEQVSATDFERGDLEQALNDKKQDEDEYECADPECSATFDYGEYETCPGDGCNEKLAWGQL